nr:Pol protein integrase region [Tanacetum cinerariifolium]
MDFIMGLPVYKGLLVILVVVDRFTKYAHFGTLHYGFNVIKVAEVFMDMVVKLHGIAKPIVADRDRIIVSKFWKQLFEANGTNLNHSTTYHPQTDGQMKVVNHGLEQYLRAMVSDRLYEVKGGARVTFEDEFRASEEREVSCKAQQGRSRVKRKLFGSFRNKMGNELILELPEGLDNFVVMREARVRMRT